jgi:hypothetical protein
MLNLFDTVAHPFLCLDAYLSIEMIREDER